MKRRVQQAVDGRKKIVWLDECVFTKSTCQKLEWSRPHTNLRIPSEVGTGYTAVCAAISEGCGVEHIELYDQALNEESFKEYLKVLASKKSVRNSWFSWKTSLCTKQEKSKT